MNLSATRTPPAGRALAAAALLLLAGCPSKTVKEKTRQRAPRAREAPTPKRPPAAPACTVGPGEVLGSAPLCEASAARVAPWDPATVLVADNEVHGRLFAFAVDSKGRLTRPRELKIEAGDHGPVKDIEALVPVGDRLLLVGSHSRNKRCCPKKKRRRMQLLAHRGGRLEVVQALKMGNDKWSGRMKSAAACASKLFTKSVDAHALVGKVCAALVAADERGRCGCKGPDCPGCHTLNIEGAVAVSGRIWIGLRAPLVSGKAALLRLAPLGKRLRFDAAALLDLGGQGVRELAPGGARVWGIAGPPLDSPACFELWSLEAAGLRHGATLTPDKRRWPLPTSSEGLVVRGGKALVLVDGAEGDGGTCAQPSRQYVVDVSSR